MTEVDDDDVGRPVIFVVSQLCHPPIRSCCRSSRPNSLYTRMARNRIRLRIPPRTGGPFQIYRQSQSEREWRLFDNDDAAQSCAYIEPYAVDFYDSTLHHTDILLDCQLHRNRDRPDGCNWFCDWDFSCEKKVH